MLVTVISGFKASVQTELNAFFAHLANQADLTRKASAQAFSKARKQFSHRAFACFRVRLLSARLGMMLSTELYSTNVGERQMLFEHLHKLNADDLWVLVRGLSRVMGWLIAHLIHRHPKPHRKHANKSAY